MLVFIFVLFFKMVILLLFILVKLFIRVIVNYWLLLRCIFKRFIFIVVVIGVWFGNMLIWLLLVDKIIFFIFEF